MTIPVEISIRSIVIIVQCDTFEQLPWCQVWGEPLVKAISRSHIRVEICNEMSRNRDFVTMTMVNTRRGGNWKMTRYCSIWMRNAMTSNLSFGYLLCPTSIYYISR